MLYKTGVSYEVPGGYSMKGIILQPDNIGSAAFSFRMTVSNALVRMSVQVACCHRGHLSCEWQQEG
jgi:hypothetical protein